MTKPEILNSLLFTHSSSCTSNCPACGAEKFLKSKLGDDYPRYVEMRRVAAGLPAQTRQIKFTDRVTVLDLQRRCHTALKRKNVVFLGDLVQMTDKELDLCGMGKVFLSEIKKELARFGLNLGIEIPHWPNPEFFPALYNHEQ